MRRSLILALAAVLALASPAFGAASSPVTETLTVLASTTLTGVPASLTYGSSLAGATVTSGTAFTMTASSTSPAGYNVSWAATDLTSGANTILSTARSFLLTTPGAGCATVGASTGYTIAPGKAYNGPAGTAQNVVNRTTAGSCAVAGVVLSVAIPAGAIPGPYTGTTTFAVTEL